MKRKGILLRAPKEAPAKRLAPGYLLESRDATSDPRCVLEVWALALCSFSHLFYLVVSHTLFRFFGGLGIYKERERERRTQTDSEIEVQARDLGLDWRPSG